MMSVSEDEKGGTIQLWRICDMIYRPEKEVLAELEQHRCNALGSACLQLPAAPCCACRVTSSNLAVTSLDPILSPVGAGSAPL